MYWFSFLLKIYHSILYLHFGIYQQHTVLLLFVQKKYFHRERNKCNHPRVTLMHDTLATEVSAVLLCMPGLVLGNGSYPTQQREIKKKTDTEELIWIFEGWTIRLASLSVSVLSQSVYSVLRPHFTKVLKVLVIKTGKKWQGEERLWLNDLYAFIRLEERRVVKEFSV